MGVASQPASQLRADGGTDAEAGSERVGGFCERSHFVRAKTGRRTRNERTRDCEGVLAGIPIAWEACFGGEDNRHWDRDGNVGKPHQSDRVGCCARGRACSEDESTAARPAWCSPNRGFTTSHSPRNPNSTADLVLASPPPIARNTLVLFFAQGNACPLHKPPPACSQVRLAAQGTRKPRRTWDGGNCCQPTPQNPNKPPCCPRRGGHWPEWALERHPKRGKASPPKRGERATGDKKASITGCRAA